MEVLGTPVTARRPGPEGPRASIIEVEMDSSLDSSAADSDNETPPEEEEEDRRIRSEYWTSYASTIPPSSMSNPSQNAGNPSKPVDITKFGALGTTSFYLSLLNYWGAFIFKFFFGFQT